MIGVKGPATISGALYDVSGGSWSGVSATHPLKPRVVGAYRLGGRLRLPPEPVEPVPKPQPLFFAHHIVAVTIVQAGEQFGVGRLVVAVYIHWTRRCSRLVVLVDSLSAQHAID